MKKKPTLEFEPSPKNGQRYPFRKRVRIIVCPGPDGKLGDAPGVGTGEYRWVTFRNPTDVRDPVSEDVQLTEP